MDHGDGALTAEVSRREAEVLDLLGEHLTHAEIGARLFISVRTVESHVASLRRKLNVADHRSLVRLADARQHESRTLPSAGLPSPLTSFVGRLEERAALVDALAAARLVTVLGPGGVGKTRLAIATAERLGDSYREGVLYVDLVPVSEPDRAVAAVSAAVGIAEPGTRTHEDAIVGALASRHLLLVLDNCEHLVNAVAVLVERLLRDCPRLVVLVTSRVRLVVPFERIVPIGGLSLPPPGHDDDDSDAVSLFLERSAAAGAASVPEDRPRVTRVCRALDGVALAIELAAARVATLGLDGVERGLSDHETLLVGGPRLNARHRSVRDTLDWSYRLLDPIDQTVLRRVCTFQAPFRTEDATAVAGWEPVLPSAVAAALGRLVEHSLLVALVSTPGVRYRALETVRQHGSAQLLDAGDEATRERHLDWCRAQAGALDREQRRDEAWVAALDAVGDDMRAAVVWAASRPQGRGEAHDLARRLAGLLFLRGHTTEAQQRYEDAAALTDDPSAAATDLQAAAAVAKCRLAGSEALRLEQSAARAATDAGDAALAAVCLARAAEVIARFRGMFDDTRPRSYRRCSTTPAPTRPAILVRLRDPVGHRRRRR